MREDIPQFTAFVNGSWSFRRAMAADSAGKRELLEEFAQAVNIQAFFGIDFRIRSLQVCRAKNSRRSMARSRKEDHVEVILLDQPVEVNIDEGEPGTRSPMAEQ